MASFFDRRYVNVGLVFKLISSAWLTPRRIHVLDTSGSNMLTLRVKASMRQILNRPWPMIFLILAAIYVFRQQEKLTSNSDAIRA